MTTQCRDLRVEYLDEPIGVGTRVPRFSWTVDRTQHAYRLEVRAGERVVWDTGRVASSTTCLVEYDGRRLDSNAAYRWRVTSWGADGAPATAESRFETALLDPADWTAAWVEPVQDPTTIERWSLLDWILGRRPEAPVEERLRPVRLLRQEFALDRAPLRARLYATARGAYAVTVNGHPGDDQVLAPGFDSYEHRISVQCYDVTRFLAAGPNVIGIALADGWWAGRIGISGSSAQFGDTTSAVWQLHVEYPDGTEQVVGSGPDVVSTAGPWRYADLFIGECLDARAIPIGWDRPEFDARDWQPVREAGRDHAVLVPFTGEPIRRVAELPARSVTATDDGWLVDFGQVVAGRVRLRVRGAAPGRRILIEHTEVLDADGGWFRNILGANKEQADVYLAAGVDEEVYEPKFTFHGFRYARVSGLDRLEPDDIVAIVLASDLPQTGGFHTSDARLNRLHDNVVWSQRANFLSVPTDCPQRERAGWTGDIQVFAPAATNNAMVAPFLARWLDNLRADILPSGEVPITSPRSPHDRESAAAATDDLGRIVSATGWSDAIAFVPWTLFERYGDRRVLEENYDAIVGWIEHQRRVARTELPGWAQEARLPAERRARQALLYNTGRHFGDWLTPSTLEGDLPRFQAMQLAPALTSELLAPMYQAQTLTIAARIAAVLGRTADAADFADRAVRVREAFAAEYVDADGALPHDLQGLYVVALAFDMVPAALRAAAADRLATLVRNRGDRLDTGFLSVPYLLDVLWEAGHRELARRVLWQSESPSWLYEVDHGATTIWETWDAVGPDGTPQAMSFNHYAFGCVDDWLYRRIAGIRATSPGYRTVVIEPDLEAGVDRVDAHVQTPAGRLAVSWRRDGAEASIDLVIPSGVDAVLRVDGVDTPVPAGESHHDVPVAAPTPPRAPANRPIENRNEDVPTHSLRSPLPGR
ncbi:family 78 glycoside hydrolase catalytic domain [Agromyces sp. MMS24-JH15]|uniref:family 78 glycoside hydrolase catalytic domain n=1 Tax=Agromyces sp. MMS24-JH15 TaxID=3243765 RepID=UPI00374A515F